MNGKKVMSVLAATALISSNCIAMQAQEIQPKPNFLFIFCDDMSYTTSHNISSTLIKTPNLDALEQQGIYFNNAYAPVASCSPSRACVLTGMYPHENGVWSLVNNIFEPTGSIQNTRLSTMENDETLTGIHEDIPTMFEIFRQNGYESVQTEKNHVEPVWKSTADVVMQKGRSYASQKKKDLDDYLTGLRDQTKPFFMWMNLGHTHRPWDSAAIDPAYQVDPNLITPDLLPPMFQNSPTGRQDYANYLSTVQTVDSCVGALIQSLKDMGVYDNTYIIFTSDQGMAIIRGKATAYTTGLKIPLIISGPGVRKGILSNEMVSLVDIMPTVLDYCGIDIPENVSGMSLKPYLNGDTDTLEREYIFGENNAHAPNQFYPQRMITDGRYYYVRNLQPELTHAIIDDSGGNATAWGNISYPELIADHGINFPAQWAIYQRTLKPPAEEFFDTEGDAYCITDLINTTDPQLAEKLGDMRQALTQWQSDTNDNIPANTIIRRRYGGLNVPVKGEIAFYNMRKMPTDVIQLKKTIFTAAQNNFDVAGDKSVQYPITGSLISVPAATQNFSGIFPKVPVYYNSFPYGTRDIKLNLNFKDAANFGIYAGVYGDEVIDVSFQDGAVSINGQSFISSVINTNTPLNVELGIKRAYTNKMSIAIAVNGAEIARLSDFVFEPVRAIPEELLMFTPSGSGYTVDNIQMEQGTTGTLAFPEEQEAMASIEDSFEDIAKSIEKWNTFGLYQPAGGSDISYTTGSVDGRNSVLTVTKTGAAAAYNNDAFRIKKLYTNGELKDKILKVKFDVNVDNPGFFRFGVTDNGTQKTVVDFAAYYKNILRFLNDSFQSQPANPTPTVDNYDKNKWYTCEAIIDLTGSNVVLKSFTLTDPDSKVTAYGPFEAPTFENPDNINGIFFECSRPGVGLRTAKLDNIKVWSTYNAEEEFLSEGSVALRFDDATDDKDGFSKLSPIGSGTAQVVADTTVPNCSPNNKVMYVSNNGASANGYELTKCLGDISQGEVSISGKYYGVLYDFFGINLTSGTTRKPIVKFAANSPNGAQLQFIDPATGTLQYDAGQSGAYATAKWYQFNLKYDATQNGKLLFTVKDLTTGNQTFTKTVNYPLDINFLKNAALEFRFKRDSLDNPSRSGRIDDIIISGIRQDFNITDMKFKSGSTEIKKISEVFEGGIGAKVHVFNNSPDKRQFEVMIAAYDSSNKLLNVSTTEAVAVAGFDNDIYTNEISTNGASKFVVYIWRERSTMAPIYQKTFIN